MTDARPASASPTTVPCGKLGGDYVAVPHSCSDGRVRVTARNRSRPKPSLPPGRLTHPADGFQRHRLRHQQPWRGLAVEVLDDPTRRSLYHSFHSAQLALYGV
jgi:hypothetical protein